MIYSDACWIYDKCKKYNEGTCTLSGDYCQKLFRLDELYNQALLTPQQRKPIVLYDDADGKDAESFSILSTISKNIELFISEGHNLYLYSPYAGNGKTSWALRLISSYFNCIWHKSIDCKALFINVPRFLLELKSNISEKSDYIEHIKNNILNADLVVWDDIGTKVGTEYELENLLSYVSARIDLNKSNIYTSNIEPANVSNVLGGRLYSRIISMSTVVGLFGSDKRGLKV